MFCIVLYNHSRACKIVLSVINRKGKTYVLSFVRPTQRETPTQSDDFLAFLSKTKPAFVFFVVGFKFIYVSSVPHIEKLRAYCWA